VQSTPYRLSLGIVVGIVGKGKGKLQKSTEGSEGVLREAYCGGNIQSRGVGIFASILNVEGEIFRVCWAIR
jgi:hypothetical protein